MKKMPANNETSKSPRTVQQMVPWLNAQFGSLKNIIRRIAGVEPCKDHFRFDAPTSRETVVRDLVGSLHQALSHLELLLTEASKPALESATIADFSRAMLLAGSGERFEPAVRSAIRAYADTCQEQFRFTHQKGIGERLREDVLAGFARIAATQEQDLRVLGVVMETVEQGCKLDTTCHQVVKQLVTDNASRLHTVRFCITPIFRWKSDQVTRVEPARVVAFTRLEKPEDGRPSDSPSPGGPGSKPSSRSEAAPDAASGLERHGG